MKKSLKNTKLFNPNLSLFTECIYIHIIIYEEDFYR